MSQANTVKTPAHQGRTERKDNWWMEPALVFVGFLCFIVYATFRTFENAAFEYHQFLSPFYSPKLIFEWWKFSPAILILWVPAGFRATCYYYRKAYYRAYFWTPPACGVVGTKGSGYCGETSFPWILQNAHRYFFYAAAIVLLILWYDALSSFINEQKAFSVSLLSLVMVTNCVLLSGYTFGCHAYRHLCGGALDCFSCDGSAKRRFKIWHLVSKLNEHHMAWAWLSLFSVGFTDFYIREVCMGTMNPVVFF